MTRKEAFGIFAEAMATGVEVTGKVLEAKGIIEQFGFDSDKLERAIRSAFGTSKFSARLEMAGVLISEKLITTPEEYFEVINTGALTQEEPTEKELTFTMENKKSKKGKN